MCFSSVSVCEVVICLHIVLVFSSHMETQCGLRKIKKLLLGMKGKAVFQKRGEKKEENLDL